MKKLLILLIFITQLISAPVMSWIPPYATAEGKANFETWGINGLTYIAMQFWVPDGGSVAKSKYEANGEFNDAYIREIRDTAHAHNIKALLCVYNGDDGWDWNLAKNSFINNKTAFINSLIDEMNRLGLDGIEIDLEGPNVTSESDGNAYISFIEELSAKLHSQGKILTIASFHSEYHTPGPRHWDRLLPLVDALTTMGYNEIGINGTSSVDTLIFKPTYAGQKALASGAPEKLMLGMLSSSESWQGNSAIEQINWAKENGVGLAIWDMQLKASSWTKQSTWDTISQIRGSLVTTYNITASAETGGSISPSGTIAVDSSKSKTFTITPDKWFIIDQVIVDGVNKGSLTEYSFSDISKEHTIVAKFRKDPNAPTLHTITVDVDSTYGTVSSNTSITLPNGEDTSLSITPHNGYIVGDVTIDDITTSHVVSFNIHNIIEDHNITVNFTQATGGDLGKYPEWNSSIAIPNGDTCYWNDSLWMYQGSPNAGGWGSNMEPSRSLEQQYGTPPWKYVGLYNGIPDTLLTANVDYYEAIDGSDTIITVTDTTIAGVKRGQKRDTLILSKSAIISNNNHMLKPIAIHNNGNSIVFPMNGTANITVLDLRGRILFSKDVDAKAGIAINTINGSSISKGIYLLKAKQGTLISIKQFIKR